MPVTPRFDWRANFNLDVRSSYSLPQGVGLSSYVTFESILKELQLSHSNEKKLQTLAHELTKNSSGDYMMKVGLCVSSALVTTYLFAYWHVVLSGVTTMLFIIGPFWLYLLS